MSAPATTTSLVGADGAEMREFSVKIPKGAIDDLRRRLAETRFPEKETVDDQSQGVQLETIQALTRYWAEQAYPNLIYFNEVDQGNHFAAWPEPEIFTGELRAAFKSLRRQS